MIKWMTTRKAWFELIKDCLQLYHHPKRYIAVNIYLIKLGVIAQGYDTESASDMEAFERNSSEIGWPILNICYISARRYRILSQNPPELNVPETRPVQKIHKKIHALCSEKRFIIRSLYVAQILWYETRLIKHLKRI